MHIVSQLLNLLPSLLLMIFLYLPMTTAADNFTSTYPNTWSKPGCPSKCGNLTVLYPFGINNDCSASPVFVINCDAAFDPPKAFIGNGLEVLGISETKIRVKNRIAWSRYDSYGNLTDSNDFAMNLSSTPISFSTENKLTVVGCDDVALLSKSDSDDDWSDFISSCVGVCAKPEGMSNGVCAGIGCCQASIPKGLRFIYATLDTLNYHEYVANFSRCGYTFLAQHDGYTFNLSDISDSSFSLRVIETVPLVLDWAIGKETCDQIRGTSKSYAWRTVYVLILVQHVQDTAATAQKDTGGIHIAAQVAKVDIDECKSNPCHPTAQCRNFRGSFECSCPANHIGSGAKNGQGCLYLPPPKNLALFAGLPGGLGLFLLMAVTFWLYKMLKIRRKKQLKRHLFKRNGGLLLKQQTSAHDSVLEKVRIFTSKELERATHRFSEGRILGRGGQGTVYKGMLSDGRIVAVKKSKQVNENQLEEFINEVVVKLLGCCLETEVPLLVYEFVPNGTLYHLIQDHDTGFPFSWDLRLKIAVEIANAIAYLHNATSVPIYHRDMKSANILLDEKYRAKLSDFGISGTVAIDQTHLTTMVKRTFGYLDPEYFQTWKFTEKSDVYSFGVVLVELLTGHKQVETVATEEERISLVTRFLLTMEEKRLRTILDSRIIEQGVKEEHIAVSDLAKRCLNLSGKKRPTIREVAVELESIKGCDQNPSSFESNVQEISCRQKMKSLVHIGFSDSWTQNVQCTAETRC